MRAEGAGGVGDEHDSLKREYSSPLIQAAMKDDAAAAVAHEPVKSKKTIERWERGDRR